jgi:hypothetical protein
MYINRLADFRRARRDPPRGARWAAAAAALWLVVAATPVQADPRSELAQARHDLAVSEQVLSRITARVELARADPATGRGERQRLDEYLAHVRELVALNRERVRTLAQAVEALPPGAPSATPGGVRVPAVPTDAEEVAALDAKLGGSLAEFDQLLLEEARKAQVREQDGRSRGPSSAGSNGGAARKGARGSDRGGRSTGGAAGGGEPQAGDRESSASEGSASDRDADPRGSAGEKGSAGGRVDGADPGATAGVGVTPPDVGNGSDDDIVARQIRKAAESETDPELRKKLWDEYRKYKQGVKG